MNSTQPSNFFFLSSGFALFPIINKFYLIYIFIQYQNFGIKVTSLYYDSSEKLGWLRNSVISQDLFKDKKQYHLLPPKRHKLLFPYHKTRNYRDIQQRNQMQSIFFVNQHEIQGFLHIQKYSDIK